MAEYQPRFAAFLAWSRRAVNTTAARVSFLCDFIPLCRRTAPRDVVQAGRVLDHEAFTAHCWAVAGGQGHG